MFNSTPRVVNAPEIRNMLYDCGLNTIKNIAVTNDTKLRM